MNLDRYTVSYLCSGSPCSKLSLYVQLLVLGLSSLQVELKDRRESIFSNFVSFYCLRVYSSNLLVFLVVKQFIQTVQNIGFAYKYFNYLNNDPL